MPYKLKSDKIAFDKCRRQKSEEVIEKWFSEHPCVDCGNSDRRVLEPDHVKGKNFTIGGSRQRSISSILAELSLCESRCANCHKIRHYGEKKHQT